MTIYDLKPQFQTLLQPVMQWLADQGVTPNAITLSAMVGSVLVGGSLPTATRFPVLLLLLPIWLLLRMALNAIDGMLAKQLRMATRLGAVLNELGDVVSDLSLFVPLAVLHPPARWPILIFAIGGVMTEFCGVLAQAIGGRRQYGGPMGKSDRAFFVGVLGLISYFSPTVFRFWAAAFLIGACLSVVTCLNRVAAAVKETHD